MKVKLIFLIGLIATSFAAYGQYAGGQVGPSKSSTSVGSGSSLVNVDLFTGIGSVTVPIYSYSISNLSLGISLNYNAKGVKVDELATSVGLGWQLDAGGMITRQVYGIEDEVTTPALFTIPDDYDIGYLLYSNYHDTLQGILVPGSIDPLYPPSDTLHWPVYDDEEHDLFHVSFGGRSLDFAFKGNGSSLTYITYPKSEVTIEVLTYDWDLTNHIFINERSGVVKNIGLDTVHNILAFRITDEAGNKFYFERGDYRVKQLDLPTNGTFADPNPTYYPVENWVLSKVVTISGLEIRYTYVKKYMEYVEDVSETLISLPNTTNPPFEPLQIKKIEWKGYKNHISKIEYPNGVTAIFDLNYGTNARCDCRGDFRLEYIKLESKVDNNYKNFIKYRLNHAYFNTPKYGNSSTEIAGVTSCTSIEGSLSTDSLSKSLHLDKGLRLKLKSIDRMGTDNSATEPYYSFTYNSTSLPYRFGPQKDIYGYYNGSTTDTAFIWTKEDFSTETVYTSIPYHVINTSEGHNFNDGGSIYDPNSQLGTGWGANRSYNFTNAQAAVLTSVLNGSGGKDSLVYSNFTLANLSCSYGDHEYRDIGCTIDTDLQGETENDGLVVGKVIRTDRFTIQNITTTEYSYHGGQRFFRGGYFDYPHLYALSKNYTNYFTDPHKEFRGSNHGFDTVVVTTTGYGNERLSKSLHTFSNLMYEGESGLVSNLQKPTHVGLHTAHATFNKFRMGLPLIINTYDDLDYLSSKQEFAYSDVIALPDNIQNFTRIIDHDDLPGSKIGGGDLPPVPPTGGCCWTCWPEWHYYLLDYERVRVTGKATTNYVYDGGTKTFVTSESYTHNSNDQLKSVTWQDSKGDFYRKWFNYNYDYSSGMTVTPISEMNSAGLQHLISTEIWLMSPTTPPFTDSLLISMELSGPEYSGIAGVLRLPNVYTSIMNAPLSSANAASTTYINRANALLSNSSAGSALVKANQINLYDNKGHALETYFTSKDIYESEIWDTHFDQKIASVSNAKYEDIAYTSFDGIYEALGTPDYNKGNWDFSPVSVEFFNTAPGAATGKYVYRLDYLNQMFYHEVESKVLNTKPYIVSLWSYEPDPGSALEVTLHDGNSATTAVTMTLLKTVGSWKLFVGTATPASGEHLVIHNTGSDDMFIDEVRLYPVEASMSTATYKPLFGAGSTCNANNEVINMEYDVQGRPMIVRDCYGNIISKTEIAVDNSDPNSSSSSNPSY